MSEPLTHITIIQVQEQALAEAEAVIEAQAREIEELNKTLNSDELLSHLWNNIKQLRQELADQQKELEATKQKLGRYSTECWEYVLAYIDGYLKNYDINIIGELFAQGSPDEWFLGQLKADEQLADCQKKLEAWSRALQELTPNGSDFGTPTKCKEWVQDRLRNTHEIAVKAKIELADQQSLVGKLREALGHLLSYEFMLRAYMEDDKDVAYEDMEILAFFVSLAHDILAATPADASREGA